MEMGLGELLCLNYCKLNLIIPVTSVLSSGNYSTVSVRSYFVHREPLSTGCSASCTVSRSSRKALDCTSKREVAQRPPRMGARVFRKRRQRAPSAREFGLSLAFDRPAAVLTRSQPQVRALFTRAKSAKRMRCDVA